MTWNLVADIGGTNARFAAVGPNGIGTPEVYPSAMGVTKALAEFLNLQETMPQSAALAFAGVTTPEQGSLTNAGQIITRNEVAQLCQSNEIHFLNDFEAAAWSLATIDPAYVKVLQGPDEIPTGNRLIIGPGTGLGVGSLIKNANGWTAVKGEGGHVAISPNNAFEAKVFEAFVEHWPETQLAQNGWRLEAEAFLCGSGLPYLYRAVADVLGQEYGAKDARGVLELVAKGDPAAIEMAKIFRSHLGSTAGDMAVTLLTKGGVFVTGGVAEKNPWLFDAEFLAAFNAGGRFDELRRSIPVYAYQHPMFGLIGAKNALAELSN
ncbi:MAG: ROK family protein [Paracoccaceae bacterium]|nr:ROK family protein [Paracoccaceae bacterium]